MSELRKPRRHLPHWRMDGGVYYVTFNTVLNELDPECRKITLDALKFFHLSRILLHIAVVMPDHVHAIMHPLEKSSGNWHELSDILKTIKGYSARKINEHLQRNGQVWQPESHDRILRNESEFLEKWNYIFENPIRAEIVELPEDYEYTFIPDSVG
ncbi:MAG: transposase [Calditrichaeota bacterium]|nr:transposase [Calditrichota bacterium]MBT7618377.1 transposase [Calditrichota bacterium]MBT7789729.1 transposase [Calditrichota bacterium]